MSLAAKQWGADLSPAASSARAQHFLREVLTRGETRDDAGNTPRGGQTPDAGGEPPTGGQTPDGDRTPPPVASPRTPPPRLSPQTPDWLPVGRSWWVMGGQGDQPDVVCVRGVG